MRKTTLKSRRGFASGIASGFTLLEVMVVAVIVVLMLAMALPVFRAITGSRSEAGATNHITAMLNRARTDAIGLQKTMGVAFIVNSSTQAQTMAEVEFPDCAGWNNLTTYYSGTYVNYAAAVGALPYWRCTASALGTSGTPPAAGANWIQVGGPPLDLRVDTDVLPLPAGIGVQTVCNCNVDANGKRLTDGYLNMGVILFDGLGRMTCQNYGISSASTLATGAGLGGDYPQPAAGVVYPTGSTNYGTPSQFGLVVFQHDAYATHKSPTPDPFYTKANTSQQDTYQNSGSPTPLAEEQWLDQNATPLVIDRYTGTLIRAE